MPDRIVRADILTSETVASLSWGSEVFYRRLMSVADDYGRFDGRADVLRARLYTFQLDKVGTPDVGKWMLETAEAGLVRRYSVDGKDYVQIEKFRQRIQSASKWPAPQESPDIHGGPPLPTVPHGDSRLYSESYSVKKDGGQKPPPTRIEKPAAGYSEAFASAFAQYPKRNGDTKKKKAYQGWCARLKEGHTPETMQAGVQRYADWCTATGKVGSEFVMQASRFFGPDKPFEQAWDMPTARNGAAPQPTVSSPY